MTNSLSFLFHLKTSWFLLCSWGYFCCVHDSGLTGLPFLWALGKFCLTSLGLCDFCWVIHCHFNYFFPIGKELFIFSSACIQDFSFVFHLWKFIFFYVLDFFWFTLVGFCSASWISESLCQVLFYPIFLLLTLSDLNEMNVRFSVGSTGPWGSTQFFSSLIPLCFLYWLILFFQFTESFFCCPHSAGEPVHGLFTLFVETVCSKISV